MYWTEKLFIIYVYIGTIYQLPTEILHFNKLKLKKIFIIIFSYSLFKDVN